MLSLDALCVLRPGSNIGQRIKPIADVLMIIYLKGKSSLVVDMCSPRLMYWFSYPLNLPSNEDVICLFKLYSIMSFSKVNMYVHIRPATSILI